jgi:hypothetical protein
MDASLKSSRAAAPAGQGGGRGGQTLKTRGSHSGER